jgi:hypothetical protein
VSTCGCSLARQTSVAVSLPLPDDELLVPGVAAGSKTDSGISSPLTRKRSRKREVWPVASCVPIATPSAGIRHGQRKHCCRNAAVLHRRCHVICTSAGRSVFKKVVGGPGFEPGASRSRTVLVTGLESGRLSRCPREPKLPHPGIRPCPPRAAWCRELWAPARPSKGRAPVTTLRWDVAFIGHGRHGSVR